MALEAPPPVSANPLRRLGSDLVGERRLDGPLPPGDLDLSIERTRRMVDEPLAVLLDAYGRYGPIFTLRVLHSPIVFMLGPAANHFVLVSHADRFHWREGSFGDLIPLLGDGLLTIDGSYHDRSRRIMLPAFHRDRILASGEVMLEEACRAVGALRPDEEIHVYDWTRHLALRIAMRALFGLDPDRAAGIDLADEFERGLSFYSHHYHLQLLRGPGTPWARMQRARERLDAVLLAEIARRRAAGGGGEDLLSLLLDASDEDGSRLDDGQVRDQAITLLFAGHDTTTSTVAFLLHLLDRHPQVAERLQAEQAQLGERPPSAEELFSGLPELSQAVDETLRLYPPAWIGPRRAVADFSFAGHRVPAGVAVNYCSWASHRLPDVFPQPEAFLPERFAPAERAKLPKGAYVPFGGGSRICIGMRFGLVEVKAIASILLRRFRPEHRPGYELQVRQAPTISPRDGLPMRLRTASSGA